MEVEERPPARRGNTTEGRRDRVFATLENTRLEGPKSRFCGMTSLDFGLLRQNSSIFASSARGLGYRIHQPSPWLVYQSPGDSDRTPRIANAKFYGSRYQIP